MWFPSWLRNRTSTRVPQGRQQHRPSAPRFRPYLEALEDRTLPSTFYAATASDLIADIKAANRHGGANTIALTAPTSSPYVLTAVDNTTDGPTVLPVITNGDTLTILTGNGAANPGYGDIVDASKYGRLFAVASGGSLTLENVTLQNGYAFGSGVSAEGGAIYNQGTLVLSEAMIQNNTAVGRDGLDGTKKSNVPGPGQDAAGGGIWSNGSLTVENLSVIQGNAAVGGAGGYSSTARGAGGNAFGGGIYLAGGTANITNSTFGTYNPAFQLGIGNTAQGGVGDNGGAAYGGAVYVADSTVTMSGDTFDGNNAQGGNWALHGFSGIGYGGGLYVASGSVTLTNDSVVLNVAGDNNTPGYGGGIFIASGATAYLDSFTVAHTTNNSDSLGLNSSTANIDGTYILLP